MSFIKNNHYSNTFLSIIKYIAVTMLLVLIIFSEVLYLNFKRTGLNMTYDLNRKTITQLSNNISYMNDMVKNFCITQFFNADVRQLMLSKENGSFDIQKILNRFIINVSGNSSIHSAIIYNNVSKEYFSTLRGIAYYDEEIFNMIKNNKSIPLLTPIPRILNSDNSTTTEVFTYFIYDSIDKNGIANGSLIVNVKIDWLSSNLNKIKILGSDLIIINKQGQVITDGSGKFKMFEKTNYIISDTSKDTISIESINGKKRVISFSAIPNTDWMLINDEPYEVVFKDLNKIKNQTILFTIIFLILALVLSIIISKRVYSPFNKLIQQVKKSYKETFSENDLKDDLGFLSKAYTKTENNFEKLQDSTSNILKENFIKSMLMENNFTVNKFLEQNFNKFVEVFSNTPKLVMIILKIDHYYVFKNLDIADKKLYKFVISNITSEIFSAYCKNEIIDMGNNELIEILDISSLERFSFDDIVQKIKEIQLNVNKYSNITISAFIGEAVDDINLLAKYYKDIQNMTKYKIFFGHSCILNNKIVKKLITDGNFSYPTELEKKLIGEIKYSNIESITEQYINFINVISCSGYENFMMSIMYFSQSISKLINEINGLLINEIDLDFNAFYVDLLNLETSDEINNKFIHLFKTIAEHKKDEKENKHNIIVQSIKELIYSRCGDKNLSLKEISMELKMSPAYLGKLFKDTYNKSVAEYINDVRFEKAAQLLKNKDINIKDLINKIGFDSESNFYRLFKIYYGVTPNEYRINYALQEIAKK